MPGQCVRQSTVLAFGDPSITTLGVASDAAYSKYRISGTVGPQPQLSSSRRRSQPAPAEPSART